MSEKLGDILWPDVRNLGKHKLSESTEDLTIQEVVWLRGLDLNQRPLGYEPNELPDCSTPHEKDNTVGGAYFCCTGAAAALVSADVKSVLDTWIHSKVPVFNLRLLQRKVWTP